MDNILPELLLHIFELVVHTSHEPNLSFPPRTCAISDPESDDEPEYWWATKDDRYPDFPSGITSHETNPHTPLHLSHVCKQWRTTAFAESNLWATIYVTDGKQGFQDLFKLWLDRSGSRPLKLVFRDGYNRGLEDGIEIAAMLSLAAAHCHRWRSLKIRLRDIHLPTLEVQDALSDINTPILEELAFSFSGTLHPYEFTDNAILMEQYKGLMKSPKLRELQMWDTMGHDDEFLSSIPFRRLAILTLPMISITINDKFISSLSQCASLHTLSVSFDTCQCTQPPTLYAVHIATLRNLNVIGFSQPDIDAFLQIFDLPSLQHLSIHTDALLTVGPGLVLMDALQHWQAKLHSLELRTERSPLFGSQFAMAPFLAHPSLSTLRYLRIGGISSPDTFHLGLLTTSEGRSPLPHLQHIYIESLILNAHYDAPANMALSWSGSKERPLVVEADFLDEDDFTGATEFWERCPDRSLDKVDKKFRWIGRDTRVLEREFMIRDFSMIQGWD